MKWLYYCLTLSYKIYKFKHLTKNNTAIVSTKFIHVFKLVNYLDNILLLDNLYTLTIPDSYTNVSTEKTVKCTVYKLFE